MINSQLDQQNPMPSDIQNIPDFSHFKETCDKFKFTDSQGITTVYEKERVLGEGVFGRAYLFMSTTDPEKKVVVKCEISDLRNTYSCGKEFGREASRNKTLYNLGIFSGQMNNIRNQHFVLMPYFPGKALDKIIIYSTTELAALIIAAALALKKLHEEHGLVHEDFKPDNVIIEDFFKLNCINAKLIDLAHSREIGEEIFTLPCEYTEQSFHLAPELFTGMQRKVKININHDLFSLGATLFFLYKTHFFDVSTKKLLDERIIGICGGLSDYDPNKRWPISKAVSELHNQFICTINPSKQLNAVALLTMRAYELIAELRRKKYDKNEEELKTKKRDGLFDIIRRVEKEGEQPGNAIRKVTLFNPQLHQGWFSETRWVCKKIIEHDKNKSATP